MARLHLLHCSFAAETAPPTRGTVYCMERLPRNRVHRTDCECSIERLPRQSVPCAQASSTSRSSQRLEVRSASNFLLDIQSCSSVRSGRASCPMPIHTEARLATPDKSRQLN